MNQYLLSDVIEYLHERYFRKHREQYLRVVDEYKCRLQITQFVGFGTRTFLLKNIAALNEDNTYDEEHRICMGSNPTLINHRIDIYDDPTRISSYINNFHHLSPDTRLPRNYWYTYPDRRSLSKVVYGDIN